MTKIRPLSIQFSFSDPKNEDFFFTNTYVNKVFALRSLSIPKVGPGILYDQNYVYYLYAIFSIVSEILDVQMKAISWAFSICFEKQI